MILGKATFHMLALAVDAGILGGFAGLPPVWTVVCSFSVALSTLLKKKKKGTTVRVIIKREKSNSNNTPETPEVL